MEATGSPSYYRGCAAERKMNYRELPTSDLIARLRHAAAIWFKNDDLLLVEELIHATSAATRRPLHTASRSERSRAARDTKSPRNSVLQPRVALFHYFSFQPADGSGIRQPVLVPRVTGAASAFDQA